MQQKEERNFLKKSLYSFTIPNIRVNSLLTFLLFFIVCSTSSALAVVYVDIDAAGLKDGTSWANAYIDFQDGIDNANSEEVWVAEGTYMPASIPNPTSATTDRYFHFSLKNGVSVYGGFAGTELIRSNRDPETNPTILSGDIGTQGDSSDNCYHVFYHNDGLGLTTSAMLDGFVIRDGNANHSSASEDAYRSGGGIYNHGNSPTISNCLFTQNTAIYNGGAVRNWASDSVISNCTFTNNTASHDGGAIHNQNGVPVISFSTFSNNSASTSGGAIAAYFSNYQLKSSTFLNNTAITAGAIMNTYSAPSITNCTFDSNQTSYSYGTAIYNSGDQANPTITNCTFTGHSNIPLFNDSNSDAIIKNSIFWNTSASNEIHAHTDGSTNTVTNSVVGEYSLFPGTGNTLDDPLLGSLQDNGGPVETIAIGFTGSAFDAGTTAGAPLTDARGYDRDSSPDIGAYELMTYTVGGTITGLAGGNTVVLQNNSGDDLSVSSNTTFTFANALLDGDTYAVTVLTQPSATRQICSVTNGSGTIAEADINDVSISCVSAYTIGGTVSGLATGNSVVLQNNGGNDLSVDADGVFEFTTTHIDGSAFAVTVLTQPTTPNQTCSITDGSGTIESEDFGDVIVICVDTYTVGGTVTGLASGNQVELQNNDGDNLIVNTNGSFTFATQLEDGDGYNVTVATQPTTPNQTCSITNGTDTISAADITDVSISCVTNTYTVSGSVSGLAAGNSVELQNNSTDNLTVSSNTGFTFATALNDGSNYSVTVSTNPTSPNQTCSVTSGSGILAGANITIVSVSCVTNTYSVGGSVTGLTKGNSVVLQNNAGDNKTVSGNYSFTFDTQLDDESSYAVTVLTQPSSPNQTCTISNNSGTIAGSNVNNAYVSCITNTYTIGGTVSGIEPGDDIVLQNNLGDNLTLDTDGTFTFDSELDDSSIYDITVLSQPQTEGHMCNVTNGSGTLSGADVTDVDIVCGPDGFPWNMFLPAIIGANR